MPDDNWEILKPQDTIAESGADLLRRTARELAAIDPGSEDSIVRIRDIRRSMLDSALECEDDAQKVRVWISVLCDLRALAWRVRLRRGSILIRVSAEASDPLKEKQRIRAGLLVQRDQQLCQPSVQQFVRAMERRRLGPRGEWVSVFSLMRDGRDLAGHLSHARKSPTEEARYETLCRIIRPYIQVVDDGICAHTGFGLKDIWRYFRHSWTSPYKSLPGRNFCLLIRDAAADYHPVIGIAALGSAVVQLRIRDNWIGWTGERFVAELQANPTDEWAAWVNQRLRQQLAGIYTKDLRERGLLTASEQRRPTAERIRTLRNVAREARDTHRLYGSARDHKGRGEITRNKEWEESARTPLFLWKRASTIADILEDRRLLRSVGFTDPRGICLADALSHAAGRKAITRILRRTKAEHVGINMLDITVCGSIPPYSHLLGGKLVSLLLTSPEVREAYESRYDSSPSVIASSMAGKGVRRAPRLVLLGTTSLYGVGSSQYNRLRMPAEEVGGAIGKEIRYIEQGVTVGYGSFHFSTETLKEIRTLYAQTENGRRVKHIFGEGANPRMREVREALDQVGLPSDRLLRHGSGRVVYTIPLATNFREVLIAQSEAPDYILPGDEPIARTESISHFWTRRWLSGRIMRSGVLDAVAGHTQSYPVEHGARIPPISRNEQMPLFALPYE